MMYAETVYVSDSMLQDRALDIKRIMEDKVRRDVRVRAAREGYAPCGPVEVQWVPFHDVHEVRGDGVRGLLERFHILAPEVVVADGETCRAQVLCEPM